MFQVARLRYLPEGARDPMAAALRPQSYWTAYHTHQCAVCGGDLSIQVWPWG